MKNLNECFEYIDNLNMKDLDDFLNLSEKEAIVGTHFGFGMWLRNNLGLWTDNELTKWFNQHNIHHADDMSGIIITSYHRHKNGKDIKLQEQIDHYVQFWIESEKNEKLRLKKQRKEKLKKIDRNQ